jgi:hypothetical protein
MSKPNKRPAPVSKSARTTAPEPASAGDLSFDTGAAGSEIEVSRTVSVENNIEASALMPGVTRCPFTDGCRGKIHAFNQTKIPIADANGKTEMVPVQQLKCDKCNVVAQGYRKITGGTGLVGGRLFNRQTGKAE